MTEERISPIFKDTEHSAFVGRRADLFAFGLAALGALLSCIAALWFFLGFAENDTRPEHLASAFFLTILLFAFAIVPFGIVAKFARKAHKSGTQRRHLLWTLFLMLPWLVVWFLSEIYTPLPIWAGLIMASLAVLISIWALVSLVLDWNEPEPNTLSSQQNEMPDASK